MPNFLFTNNNLNSKSKSSNKPISKQFNNNIKSGSLINKLIARKICYCFKHNQPYVMNNGISINFNDCSNLKDAIIKYSKIISRIKAQQKRKIRINGNSYQHITNDSFIKSVDSTFLDHFETYCIVNNINGKYETNN